ncbi:MAG: type II toxin-antitoxin system RelE/ParE family toxin [Usitatibacter sp.]
MHKPIDWRGSSLEDLRAFPEAARRDAGYQLRKLQRGELADDWRPFTVVGPGTSEIRIDCPDGWFRVMYVAKFEEAIHVLHCFRKSTKQTASTDLDIARTRYKAIVAERKASK